MLTKYAECEYNHINILVDGAIMRVKTGRKTRLFFYMGVHVHVLKNRDVDARRADCSFCGENIVIRWAGNGWRCVHGRRTGAKHGNEVYRGYFKGRDVFECERCGYSGHDIRMFDINHIDCNHKNNNLDNLELLCPTCHRLETVRLWDRWDQ